MGSIIDNNQGKQTEQAAAGIIHIGHLLDYLRRVKDGRNRRGIRYQLEIIFSEYLAQLPKRGQEIVIDGKTVRGTITAEAPFGLHLLAAYLLGEGIVLMQMEV